MQVESEGNNRLPGVMTLGFIAAFSETLALSVIASKGVVPLYTALVEEPEDHIKSASAWALGQVSRHSPDNINSMIQDFLGPGWEGVSRVAYELHII